MKIHFRTVLPAGILVAVLSLCINTHCAEPGDAIEKPAAPESAAPAPFKWPTVLRGIVKDVDGKPIAGAHVRLDFEKVHEYNIGRWDEPIDSQSMVTGENGEYRFDCSKFEQLTHRPFSLTLSCTADGYADTKWWIWYGRRDVTQNPNLTNLKMLPGRTVHGRCIDPDGNPLAGAVIKMCGDVDTRNAVAGMAWTPRKTAADGKFEFNVPSDMHGTLSIWVVHPEWPPRCVQLATTEKDFGDVRMRNGSPVQGIVQGADGKPIAGAVVVAENLESHSLKSRLFFNKIATRTDAKGNYKLQPLLGKYKLYLSQAEETDNNFEQQFVVADGPPPLVAPMRVEVFAFDPQTKDFFAGPIAKVHGTIHWEDGRPVEHVEVKASYLPPENGTGIWIARAETNAAGEYTLELPNPIDNVSINAIGSYDTKRVWHSAVPVETVVAKQASDQYISLNLIDRDIDGIDWVLKPR
jgi:protocatechuate 3,4-dioxygenase beta subunit